MKLAFTKMNGLGNDFMVVEWPTGRPPPDAELIRRWADRRRGVGFDQLLLITGDRPNGGDASYRNFNADGGEIEQCGNGVRCLARFLAPRFGSELTLVSPAGPVAAQVRSPDDVSVALGVPDFRPGALPFLADDEGDRYRVDVDALHEADVDAARERRVVLQRGAESLDGRRRNRGHGDHGMRVAHRDRPELDGLAVDVDAIAVALVVREKRQRARTEVRHPQCDADVVG